MRGLRFWTLWLEAVALMLAAFCLAVGLASPSEAFRGVFEGTGFLGESARAAAAPGLAGFKVYLYGMVAGGGVGFGVLLYFVSRFALAKAEAWAWVAILVAALGWYGVDTLASLLGGVFLNAVFNTVVLVLIAVALAATGPLVWGRGRDART